MREIKFRQPCFITENRKHQFWYWHKWGIFREGLRGFECISALFPHISDMDIHQEYTGQKIDEKEIWEGDIVEIGRYKTQRGIVVYEKGAFRIKIKGMRSTALLSQWVTEFPVKIIGNIVENPELLEE